MSNENFPENDVSMLTPPVLMIRSSSNLQVRRTGIKSPTSSNSGQIGPHPSELGVLEHLKNSHRLIIENGVSKLARSFFYWILVTRTGIKSGTSSMILGQIGPFTWEILPLSDEHFAENDVSRLTTSVLIRSSSNLQVTRTGIKSRTSSISVQIALFALALLVLE